MNFIKPQEQLPTPNRLCLIKRHRGAIYIGYRNSQPLSIDPDFSRKCHWTGSCVDDDIRVEGWNLRLGSNFQDGTVAGWVYLQDSIGYLFNSENK